jgi:hypothetical protein
MFQNADPREAMRARFRALNLHDCRLLKMSIQKEPEQEADDVVLLIEMMQGPEDASAPLKELRFSSCREIRLTIDLVGKAHVDDQLGHSDCQPLSGNGAWLDPSAVRSDGTREDRSALSEFTLNLATFNKSRIRVLAGSYQLMDAHD